MSTYILNQASIASIATQSSDAVKKTALSMITKNLRGALSEADNVESLSIPNSPVIATYRDGTTREFSSAMPILKLLSIDKGNLSTLIDNFETAVILKGCAVIPELAYKEISVKEAKKETKNAPIVTTESLLLEGIKSHYDALIADLVSEYKAISTNFDLQQSYIKQIEETASLVIESKVIDVTKVTEHLIIAKLQEKIEQIESSFGTFKFSQVSITDKAVSYKLESFADSGKTTITDRLTAFGFDKSKIAFKSDSSTKDSLEMMQLFAFDLLTVKF